MSESEVNGSLSPKNVYFDEIEKKYGGVIRGDGSKIKPLVTQESLLPKEKTERLGKEFMEELNSGKKMTFHEISHHHFVFIDEVDNPPSEISDATLQKIDRQIDKK